MASHPIHLLDPPLIFITIFSKLHFLYVGTNTNICPEQVDCAVQCNIANLEPIHSVCNVPTDSDDVSDNNKPFDDDDKDYEPSVSSEDECKSEPDRLEINQI